MERAEGIIETVSRAMQTMRWWKRPWEGVVKPLG